MKTLMIVIVFMSLNARADDEEMKNKLFEFRGLVGKIREDMRDLSNGETQDQKILQDESIKLKPLFELLKKECPDDKRTSFCKNYNDLVDGLKSSIEDMGVALKRQEHEESADGIFENACIERDKIIVSENIIKQEKAISKVSGVVDMSQLRIAGFQMVQSKSQLDFLRKQFKKKFKKEMKPLSTCPTE